MAATYVRCLQVLACDGSAAEYQRLMGAFAASLLISGLRHC